MAFKKFIISILFGLSFLFCLAQSKSKTYVTHGYSKDGNGYNVCELIVHPNMDYTFKSYKVAKRKDWKNYKTSIPIVDHGKIEKHGEYYIHTKFMSGKSTDSTWVSKLSEKKIIFFKFQDNGIPYRSDVYKRLL